MVALTHIFALAGLFVSMAVASPLSAESDTTVTEFEGEVITDLDVGANDKRQATVRCLAVVGLGPPAARSVTCGSINYQPNKGTGFNPQNPNFPNCRIVTEIAFPDCSNYRVTSVTGCGTERAIDIRDPKVGCP